jgi:hypothetical protein
LVEEGSAPVRDERLFLYLGKFVIAIVGTEVCLTRGRNPARLAGSGQFVDLRYDNRGAFELHIPHVERDRWGERLPCLGGQRGLAVSCVVDAYGGEPGPFIESEDHGASARRVGEGRQGRHQAFGEPTGGPLDLDLLGIAPLVTQVHDQGSQLAQMHKPNVQRSACTFGLYIWRSANH